MIQNFLCDFHPMINEKVTDGYQPNSVLETKLSEYFLHDTFLKNEMKTYHTNIVL